MAKLEVILEELADVKEATQFDLVLMKPEKLIFSSQVSMVEDGHGRFIGHVLSMRDITALKRVDNAKMQFVNLLGNLVLRRARLASRMDNLSKVDIYEIRGLVSKFIYFTEILSGPLRLNRFKQSIKELVEKVVCRISERYGISDGIDIVVENGEDIEADIDSEKMGECLSIILENSVVYTSGIDGLNIKVLLSRNEDMVVVSIMDNGIGMTDEDIDYFLDKEYIIDRVHNTKNFSMGLLYARHVVEAHGGGLEIESELGRGTTVRISFPEFVL